MATAIGEGGAANTAIPLRQILLTAWTWLPLLPISLDTHRQRQFECTPTTPAQRPSSTRSTLVLPETTYELKKSQGNSGSGLLCTRAHCARKKNYYKTGTLFLLSKSIGVFNPELL